MKYFSEGTQSFFGRSALSVCDTHQFYRSVYQIYQVKLSALLMDK